MPIKSSCDRRRRVTRFFCDYCNVMSIRPTKTTTIRPRFYRHYSINQTKHLGAKNKSKHLCTIHYFYRNFFNRFTWRKNRRLQFGRRR